MTSQASEKQRVITTKKGTARTEDEDNMATDNLPNLEPAKP
jgi:hypothetical protein